MAGAFAALAAAWWLEDRRGSDRADRMGAERFGWTEVAMGTTREDPTARRRLRLPRHRSSAARRVRLLAVAVGCAGVVCAVINLWVRDGWLLVATDLLLVGTFAALAASWRLEHRYVRRQERGPT